MSKTEAEFIDEINAAIDELNKASAAIKKAGDDYDTKVKGHRQTNQTLADLLYELGETKYQTHIFEPENDIRKFLKEKCKKTSCTKARVSQLYVFGMARAINRAERDPKNPTLPLYRFFELPQLEGHTRPLGTLREALRAATKLEPGKPNAIRETIAKKWAEVWAKARKDMKDKPITGKKVAGLIADAIDEVGGQVPVKSKPKSMQAAMVPFADAMNPPDEPANGVDIPTILMAVKRMTEAEKAELREALGLNTVEPTVNRDSSVNEPEPVTDDDQAEDAETFDWPKLGSADMAGAKAPKIGYLNGALTCLLPDEDAGVYWSRSSIDYELEAGIPTANITDDILNKVSETLKIPADYDLTNDVPAREAIERIVMQRKEVVDMVRARAKTAVA